MGVLAHQSIDRTFREPAAPTDAGIAGSTVDMRGSRRADVLKLRSYVG